MHEKQGGTHQAHGVSSGERNYVRARHNSRAHGFHLGFGVGDDVETPDGEVRNRKLLRVEPAE